jgi:uncharacterized Zn finger protein
MGRWNRYWDRPYFPPSRPRDARGGIKSQTQRGAFGRNWWARRWIAALESFHIGARLGRGRSYARSGQALSIDVGKGIVRARVQGSRPRPYDVTIKVKQLADAQWKKLQKTLARKPIYAARLLAGEMPQDIEEAFRQAGVPLFPETIRDLETDCSCPDWSNPCKHIAAVYYLLGEEFDRDPFLIFKLRGRTREELVGGLEAPAVPETVTPGRVPRSESLPTDPAAFWQGAALADELRGVVEIPRVHAALAKRLGNFPFWRGNADLRDALERVYATASTTGLKAMLEEESHAGGEPMPGEKDPQDSI